LPSAATVRSEAEDERRSREAISPGAYFNQGSLTGVDDSWL